MKRKYAEAFKPYELQWQYTKKMRKVAANQAEQALLQPATPSLRNQAVKRKRDEPSEDGMPQNQKSQKLDVDLSNQTPVPAEAEALTPPGNPIKPKNIILYTFHNESSTTYAPLPAQIISIHIRPAILLSWNLSQKLQAATQENRLLIRYETRRDAQVVKLDAFEQWLQTRLQDLHTLREVYQQDRTRAPDLADVEEKIEDHEERQLEARGARAFLTDRVDELAQRASGVQRIAAGALEEVFAGTGLQVHGELLESTPWDVEFEKMYAIPAEIEGWAEELEEAKRMLGEKWKQTSELTPQEEAEEKYAQAVRELRQAQKAFGSLQDENDVYWQRRDYASGTTSELNRRAILRYRDVARRLTAAEEAVRVAKARAVEVGIDVLDDSQSSVFGDVNDLNFESGRLLGNTDVSMDRAKIERWIEGVERAEDAGCHSPHGFRSAPVADEWEFRSVALGEGASVVAEHRPRQRIDEWRRLCQVAAQELPEELRPGQSRKSVWS